VHRSAVPVGDADQVADLHLAEAQGHVAPADVPAGLDHAGGLADAPVANNTGSEIGAGEDLPEDPLHLLDVHRCSAILWKNCYRLRSGIQG